jgi:hypothetical protein
VRLLPELLPELARAYGVNFLGDSYWNAPSVPRLAAGAEPRPLFEVLDGLTGPNSGLTGPRCDWDRSGSLIRIRDRRWFVDRPREIPLRTVRRWAALQERLGALPLEEFVLAATTLTDLQVDTLEGLFNTEVLPSQLADLRSLSGSLSLLRLYARLSPDQRQALEAGKPMAMAQLSPAQRPLVLAQLKRTHRWRLPLPDMEQWGASRLSLTHKTDFRIREQRGQSVTYRLESAPAPRTATRPEKVTRFPLTMWSMAIDYGAEPPPTVGVTTAADVWLFPGAPETVRRSRT